ncbi:methyltransferase LaeA [Coniochaeta sp. 2T2.1]|nr:methyltransferase LaeA [Coniochaeta sp. 2T2.1]
MIVDSRGFVFNPRREYVENGRFYHVFRKGKYLFPCDEEEKDRLDIMHKTFTVTRKGKLFSAPLHFTPGQRRNVLDLGCGTGIWAIDVADSYETDQVFVRGVDLALIQPQEIPRNVEFLLRDIETPWQDMGRDYDLIHMRTLNGSIQNYPQLYSQVYSHLKPRVGYIEQVEIDWMPRCDDGTLPPDAEILRWATELLSAMDDHGRPLRVDPQRTMAQLREAGFVDVNEEAFKVAINGWPSDPDERERGRWLAVGLNQGLTSMTLAPLTRMRDKTRADVEALHQRVKSEITTRRIHAYCYV